MVRGGRWTAVRRWLDDLPQGDRQLAAAQAALLVAVLAAEAVVTAEVPTTYRAATSAVLVAVVAVRRRHPTFAAVTVAVFYVAESVLPLGWTDPGESLSVWIAAWTLTALLLAVGELGSVRAVWLVVASSVATIWVSELVHGGPMDWAYAIFVPLLLAVGRLLRWRRWDRRRRRVRAQVEVWRDEQQVVAAERARVARELHDVVAHHVSGIVVAASAALRVLDTDPDLARTTLRSVAVSGRRTTAAMRSLLGVPGRTGNGAPGVQPGLADLDELVAHTARMGCTVDLRVDGDLSTVPPDVGLSGFRIVQEGVTNARKHAGATAVAVRVARTGTGLDIGVDDPGRSPSPAVRAVLGGGHGLVGMTERAALFGGHLDYGPTADGGWAVRAHLPVP